MLRRNDDSDESSSLMMLVMATKDMNDLFDVSDLKLIIGHSNVTLAKMTHMGNLRLNNDVILFNVLVVPEYTDLSKGKVLGNGSEFGGLCLFDKEYNKSAISNNRIVHQITCAYTPHQNGIAERKHEHLLNVARSLMFQRSSFEEAFKDRNWINVMNDKTHALYENDTWCLTDLPAGRKPIGSKWVFKIKYKSDGKIDRFKAKGFGQKEGINYEKAFSPVMDVNNAFLYGDLNEEEYMLPLPSFFNPSDKKHMHVPFKSHLDIALRLLKYLKLAPGNGIQFLKRHNGFNNTSFSDSDWAKSPITRRSIFGYCVFVNGYLISWKSKNQATLSKSSAEAEYRSMASATCEVMWIVKIMRDLNVDNLLTAELYYDNKSAIQIAANLVMHERQSILI
uniref:Ribonuclease H-like domain-containing protein n=1 Tax=Tanacetum cinerariifolium TaxID=118510 RepID=A0A699HKX1_TANCI|nr:ribonuclease H-like domain-containing protein [Tanacetum cinerariifolium]